MNRSGVSNTLGNVKVGCLCPSRGARSARPEKCDGGRPIFVFAANDAPAGLPSISSFKAEATFRDSIAIDRVILDRAWKAGYGDWLLLRTRKDACSPYLTFVRRIVGIAIRTDWREAH